MYKFKVGEIKAKSLVPKKVGTRMAKIEPKKSQRRLTQDNRYGVDRPETTVSRESLSETLKIVAMHAMQEENKARDPMTDFTYGNFKNYSAINQNYSYRQQMNRQINKA